MRWTVALVAALVLAGCSSKDEAPSAQIGILATDLAAGNLTQTMFPLLFAGGNLEGSLPITATFAPNDACFFGFPDCVGAGERTFDLTPIVPADVPVELAIDLQGAAQMNLDFDVVDAQFIQYAENENADRVRIDATLVRAEAGSVTLVVTYQFPSPQTAQGVTLTGTAHTVTRADVVPAFLPVAIKLAPGDVVNATGDGLEQFVAFPPTGEAIRAVQYPFSITVPDNGPSGTWFLVGIADEALRLSGPNQTLSARLLEITETEPVDLPANQATTFTMDVPGHPLRVGIGIGSKRIEPPGFFAGVSVIGNYQMSLRTPGNVEVIGKQATCSPTCDFSILRGVEEGFQSALLDEHLVSGTYTATITMETANDIQGYAFAVSIGSS
jgi:hypothetical protein